MSQSIKVVFIKQGRKEKEGTVTIRTIENRIIQKKSLKIKIQQSDWKKYFNTDTQRFRSNKLFPSSEHYNNIIEEQLKQLKNHSNEISLLPDEKKSFVKYWELCIKNFNNHGTTLKHQTILKKLKKYLIYQNKTDLLFKDITPIFLKEFRNYLSTIPDPKVLSDNSVVHYLKVMKSIINQSTSDDYYNYVKSPFNGLKFSVNKKSRSVLNEEEINRLLNTEIVDSNLKRTRDMFLFQVFSNGLRVSDLFLLRWDNIINNRIEYTMFKTGTEISLPLNLNLGLILSEVLGQTNLYKDILKTETIQFLDEDKNYYEIGMTKLNKLIEHLLSPPIYYNKLVSKVINDQKKIIETNMGKTIQYKGFVINQNDTRIKNYIDLRENLSFQIENKFLVLITDKIKQVKERRGGEFIFPVLSNEEFGNIKGFRDFSKLSLEQYKSIKHHTIVYNRKLKLIQQLCNIETNITSHVSRHSYTNLLLRLDNVNLYDISQSLGHSSIKITENYLRNGFNIEKVDYLNNTISRKYGKHN